MNMVVKCPVCGAENVRTYWTGPLGVEEDYYTCDNCGYFENMCYGPYVTGMYTFGGKPKDVIRKTLLLIKHWKKIRSNKIKINPDYAKYL